MTKEEYVKGKIRAGFNIHHHDGIWWESTRSGYCKPAIMFEPVNSRSQKPLLSQSILGCNHRISDSSSSTGFWQPMILKGDDLGSWSLEGLSSGNRRRRIRKGLRNNEVKKIKNVDLFKDDFARILKSTAERNGHGHPPEYYDLNLTVWWENILKIAEYTEFWGAFHEGKLAAYICFHVMGERVVVDGVKSDTDMLPGCPIDAILYTFLMDIQERGGIEEMWYGGKSNRPTLDKFKESYGFKVEEIPYQMRLLGGFLPFPRALSKLIKRPNEDDS